MLLHRQMKIKIYRKKFGDLFNELYYIYKDKCNEENNGLKTKDTKKFDYKKLRLDYQYESEEEKEQLTSKNPDKKSHLKNQQKMI